ncbi:interferon gamma receptor 2 [Menidia menidia]
MRSRCAGQMDTRRPSVTVLLLCLQATVQGLSEVGRPPPPQDVLVGEGQLSWRAGSREADTHTVEYSSLEEEEWRPVPGCLRTRGPSCPVAAALEGGGCVRLRVRAERRGRSSSWEPACSTHGAWCSPVFSLSPAPGSLTLTLSRNHSLVRRYGDHARYRVYFGEEGEPLQEHGEAASSRVLEGLQGGRRYCAQVENLLYGRPVGVAACVQCEGVPNPDTSRQAALIAAMVGGVLLVLLVPLVSYTLIFHHNTIKRFLAPPFQMPKVLEAGPVTLPSVLQQREEHYDLLCSLDQQEGAPDS